MRKRMFLTLVLSLCMANFGAFAANPRGNARGLAAANNAPSTKASSTVSVRAATRDTAATAPKANFAPVSVRAAVRNTPKVSQPTTMAARAASTQKVINNGTKVATAASNTVIDQECQNAFYGCMDSFCMIDNASGGRCQCSNRNAELSSVMDDIAKLDEQSYLMATEGVERIQMGESADQIIARAKAAGDQAVGKTPTTSNAANNQKKVRTLDLSAWNTNIFSEDEDIFDDVDVSVDASAVSNALSKTGDALYTDAAEMCIAQMPAKCNASVKVLQSVYAQKIKSDCIAFENSLKQQKIASTQKLQAAEKALRDAALDEFKDKNKYNLGGCVQRYAICMQNECGNDYSKCITLSAQENMMGGAGKVEDRTIKGVFDIVLSGSTMNQLLSKKTICDDEVLVHCENYRAQVWDKYIEGAATALKSAELNAEDNMRQNCIKTTAECFRNSCAAQWDPKSDAKNYDMCLSDPMLVYDTCKIQVEACVVATGGKADVKTEADLAGSRLWNGVKAMLGALRVDACTDQVKSCLTERCGDDFAGCVGMDTESIGDICPEDKLTACMTNYDKTTVRDYVNEIAQGLALQIDNSMLTVCQKAVNDVMMNVCGATDTCNLSEEKSEDTDIMKRNILKYQVCTRRQNMSFHSFLTSSSKSTPSFSTCKDRSSVMNGDLGKYEPVIRGENLYDCLSIEKDGDAYALKNMCVTTTTTLNKGKKVTKEVELDPYLGDFVEALNKNLKTKLNYFTADPTITYCMSGRQIQGFDGKKFGTKGETPQGRFPNLLDNISVVIARGIYDSIGSKYTSQMSSIRQQIEKDMAIAEKNLSNKQKCEAKTVTNNWIGWQGDTYRRKYETVASYDSASKVCTVADRVLLCGRRHFKDSFLYCDSGWNVKTETKKTIQM